MTELAGALRAWMQRFGVAVDAAPRISTLRSASLLVGDLSAADDALAMINVLAKAELLTSAAAVGRTLGWATALRGYLASVQLEAIEAAASLRDHRATAAQAIQARH